MAILNMVKKGTMRCSSLTETCKCMNSYVFLNNTKSQPYMNVLIFRGFRSSI